MQFTAYEAKTDMKPHQVTTNKYVQQFHNKTYTVRVPQASTKEVQVRVCKMVEKTITVPRSDPPNELQACRYLTATADTA